MKIRTIRKEKTFIPEFNKNRELPEGEQIVVNVKSMPTITEAQQYKSFRFGEGNGIEIVYPNDSVMLTKHIGAIKNIELDNGEIVNNGSSLSKSMTLELAPLVEEIRGYLLDASEPLSEGES